MKQITLAEVQAIRENRKSLEKAVYIIKKESGEYFLLMDKGELSKESPCIRCANGYAGICPKIGSLGYRKIEDFPYAKTAYEVISPKACDCNVVICSCHNYSLEVRPKFSQKVQEEMVKNFAFSYFGVENEDEYEEELKRMGVAS